MTTLQSWQQQCQEIHNACYNNDWGQVIQECNELIRYAQHQTGATSAAATQSMEHSSYASNSQQQLLIQAHAEQD